MTGLEKGKALFEKQEYNEAIEALNSFLTENENNADALYTRAICYRKIDQFKKSIADFTTMLIRLPNEPTLLCDRGISHFHNKDIESAMVDMNKAVEIDPNNPYRYSSRAYIRSRSDIDGAIADYEKAVELDPKDEIALNNLGLLHENAGRMKSAQKNYKKANTIIGYDPDKRQEEINKNTIEEQLENTASKNEETQPIESLGKIMLSVFTTKQGRKEYFNYLKSIIKKKE